MLVNQGSGRSLSTYCIGTNKRLHQQEPSCEKSINGGSDPAPARPAPPAERIKGPASRSTARAAADIPSPVECAAGRRCRDGGGPAHGVVHGRRRVLHQVRADAPRRLAGIMAVVFVFFFFPFLISVCHLSEGITRRA